ncbi:MAG: hypothetical protein IKS45_04135 [Thermoguttaceae bacterium]|nr:hypothetical protein [Thermoguttaceae bacterium]
MHFFFLLIVLVFGLSPVFAEDDVEHRSLEAHEAIPLPGQTAYLGEGLSFGLGFGVYDPLAECDCMGAWQSQLEYFYKEWLSGGANVRFFGGDLDRDAMVLYQRYRLNIRFHGVSDRYDLYAEPFLGFENTSISAFRKQVRGKKVEEQHYWWEKSTDADNKVRAQKEEEIEEDSTLVEKDNCQKLFSLDGFSIGLGVGGGVNLSRLFGATGEIHVRPYAQALTRLSTADGNVLLFNCHLSSTPAPGFMFPANPYGLPDMLAQYLYEMSSILPEPFFNHALAEGIPLQRGARGMAFNADMVCLIQFLNMGTQAAPGLR